MSRGAPEPVRGLGLLVGSMSVHLGGEPERFPVYRAAVAAGVLPPGYAVDDGAGLVFVGTTLAECVGARAGARVLRISPDGEGGIRAERRPVRVLEGPTRARLQAPAPEDISELRALRAGRHRWA